MKKCINKTLIFILLLAISNVGKAQDSQIKCGVTTENLEEAVLKIIQNAKPETGKSTRKAGENFREVRIAMIIDSTIYFRYNKDTVKIKEVVYRTFRNASAYFEKDFNVRFNVLSIEFLTKNKGYNEKNNGFNAYYKIYADYENRSDIIRDIAIIWSVALKEPYGGVASGIGNVGSNVSIIHLPSYSFDNNEPQMGIVLHELGHIMGSIHTQSCTWPEGPFEVCTDVEGECKGWAIDSRYASIMSYCSFDNLVFHPLCIDVIQKVVAMKFNPIANLPTSAPVLHYPINGVTEFYPSDYFHWKSVEKTSNYQIVFSENNDFSNPLLDSLVADNMAYIGKTFKRNTTYYWRVRAINQVGAGNWSSISIFKTNSNLKLGVPLLEKIAKDKLYDNTILAFKPVSDAKEYIIQFYKGIQVSTTSLHLEKRLTSLSNRLEILLPNISANINNNYVFRVRAVSDTTKGDWSKTSEVIEYYNKGSANIGIFKTPVNAYLSAFIYLPRTSHKRTIDYEVSKTADFKTYDIKKTIKQDYYFQTPNSEYNATLPMEGLMPNQIYYYRFKAKSETDSMNNWVTGQFTTSFESRWKTIHSGNSILPFVATTKGIFIDKKNNRWIYGSSGVFRQFPDGKIEHFTRERTSDLLANTVNAMAEDDLGRIWFATSDGMTKFENELFTRYESDLWGTKDGIGKKTDRNMMRITVGKNGTAYAYISTGKLIRFDNRIWNNVNDGNKNSFSGDLRQDINGHLWLATKDNEGKNIIKIHDGTSWSDFTPNWSFLNIQNGGGVFPDNQGSFWYYKYGKDSVFLVKNKDNYQAFYKNIIALDELNNSTRSVDLSFFIENIYATDKKTYFFYNQTYLEYDGKTFLYKYLPFTSTNSSFYKKFVVDKNDKVIYIQNSSAVHENDRFNIIADFKDKQLYNGCNLKFKIGVFEPPTGDASSLKLKVMLSEGASSTFKDITATYSKGEIIAKIPTNAVVGKGYRFKFTMGDNWYVSNESEPFEILAAPNATINGAAFICKGTTANLIAKSEFGNAPYKYSWSIGTSNIGSDNNNLSINKSGDYSVVVTDANGCIFNSIVTKITEKGVIPIITADGNTTVYAPNVVKLNTTNTPTSTFQWRKNGVDMVGETKANIGASESGDYSIVEKNEGCIGSSNTIKVVIEPLLDNEPTAKNIEVFPNPTTGQINLNFNEVKHRKIEVINTSGLVILEKTSKALKETLNLQTFPVGFYYIQIKEGTQIVSKRVLKIDK